jgi:hypothetical protein
MEKLNTIMDKITPNIMTFLQSLIICVVSFFTNLYVAGKCLFVYFSTNSLQDFSVKNYNKIISEEIESHHNPVLSNIGVYVCMCIYVNILWVILENLTIPLLGSILWWIFIWGFVFGLKEKVSGEFFSKLKMP